MKERALIVRQLISCGFTKNKDTGRYEKPIDPLALSDPFPKRYISLEIPRHEPPKLVVVGEYTTEELADIVKFMKEIEG